MHEDLAREAEVEELDASRQSEVFDPINEGDISDAVASARWVLTWMMVDGKRCVKARVAAKVPQTLI